MNRANSGGPDEQMEPDGDLDTRLHEPEPDEIVKRFEPEDEFVGYAPDEEGEFEQDARQEEEPLRRQLAQFAFVREEDDREVRLSFRDVPADEIAKTFRSSGALLISIMGERALSPSAVAARSSSGSTTIEVVPEETQAPRSRRRRNRKSTSAQASDDIPASPLRQHRHTGELTMRYFFSLRETVYTINITSPTGIVESIANIYPSASQSEGEIQSRLAVLFREGRNEK